MLLSHKVEKCGFLHDIFKEVNNDLVELKKKHLQDYINRFQIFIWSSIKLEHLKVLYYKNCPTFYPYGM